MIAGSRNERRHLFVHGKGGMVRNNDSEVIHEEKNCGEKQQVTSIQREE